MGSKSFSEILGTIAVGLLGILSVCMMLFTVISVATFNRVDRDIFGYKPFVISSDSMSKTDFDSGDLVIVTGVDPSTLNPGDIIAYSSNGFDDYGSIVVHKIREEATDTDGDPGFITYSTTTDANDEEVVTYPFIIGKYTGTCFRGVGTFFTFLKTVPGYICCILLPLLTLILLRGLKCIRKFKEYKAEQLEKIEIERDRLEAQRADTQGMLQELMAYRNMLQSMPDQQWPQSNYDMYNDQIVQQPYQQKWPQEPEMYSPYQQQQSISQQWSQNTEYDSFSGQFENYQL